MPRTSISITNRISHLGQGSMDLEARLQRRRPVGRSSDQGMTEAHPRSEVDEPGALGRRSSGPIEVEQLSRSVQECRVALCFRGSERQESLRVRRQISDALGECLFELSGNGDTRGF